jgi:paraquat-inducible protein B
VVVEANLIKQAKSVARKGTIFWVERAQVSLQGVRGLDTLVGGQYLAVQPGPIGSVPMQAFIGANEPPPTFNPIEGGLPIRLTCAERFGLERGATITYRGMPAGQVTSLSLSSDAHALQVRATIHPDFSSLIRTNTQFWSKSGLDFHIGFRGVDMAVDPLSTLTASGIAFATPAPAGATVEAGHRFDLAAEEASGWIDWRPDFHRPPAEKTVGRGQRLLNRIRSPFGGDENEAVDTPE